jgi:hypothetical protein
LIKKVPIYLLITIALLYALQWFVMEGIRRNPKGNFEKYSTIFLKKNNYNTLIAGSSRAFMHLDNSLFDSLTGSNSYNIGLAGASTRVSYIALKAYCVNSQMPKTVLFEIDYHISHLSTDTVFNFNQYIPYLGNDVLYTDFQKIDGRFRYFKHVPVYALPYLNTRSLSSALHGWLKKPGLYDDSFYKGFYRNLNRDKEYNFKVKRFTGIISSENRQYLDSVVNFCDRHHCRLIFTISPAYKDAQKEVINKDQIIEHYRNIARAKGIPLFNYSEDPDIMNNKSYFEDNYHLLYAGSRIYTRKIARDFNNITK